MSEVNKEPLELFIAKRFPTPENKVPKKVLEIGTWGDPVFRKFWRG